MIEFYETRDKELYEHFLSVYKECEPICKKRNIKLKIYEVVDGCSWGEVIAFRHPHSITWCRFKGTFTELRDKLAFDFPMLFPDVKFYLEFSSPIWF